MTWPPCRKVSPSMRDARSLRGSNQARTTRRGAERDPEWRFQSETVYGRSKHGRSWLRGSGPELRGLGLDRRSARASVERSATSRACVPCVVEPESHAEIRSPVGQVLGSGVFSKLRGNDRVAETTSLSSLKSPRCA